MSKVRISVSLIVIRLTVPEWPSTSISSPDRNGSLNSRSTPASRFSRMSWNAKPTAIETNPRLASTSTGRTDGNTTVMARSEEMTTTIQPISFEMTVAKLGLFVRSR